MSETVEKLAKAPAYHLVGNYYMDVDSRCYTLLKQLSKDGKITYSIEGYYTSIDTIVWGLGKNLLHDKSKNKSLAPLEELVSDIKSVLKELKSISAKLKL